MDPGSELPAAGRRCHCHLDSLSSRFEGRCSLSFAVSVLRVDSIFSILRGEIGILLLFEPMSEKPSPHLQLSDQPAPKDLLDFKPYTNSLVDIIRDPNTKGPLVIGLFGSWGSGKTSLMQFVRKELKNSKPSQDDEAVDAKPPASNGFRSVWFDAWKYDKEDALWRALLMRVIDSLRVWEGDEETTPDELKSDIERLEQRLYRDVEWEEKGGLTVDWPELGKGAAKGAVKLALNCLPGVSTLTEAFAAVKKGLGGGEDADGLFDAFQRDVVSHHQAQLRSLEQFQDQFGDLVAKHIVEKNERLVVFVDDLDRCLPEKAIEVLEAIKLFLDVEGCIFVLGLDHDVITRGIEVKYRDFVIEEHDGAAQRRRLLVKGAAYLEKIIQLPFRLPPIESTAIQGYVEELASFEDPRCAKVFGKGLETNPRKVKRAINIFLFLSNLARHRPKLAISPVRLAKIVVIYHSHTELYDRLRRNPSLLRDIEASLIKAGDEEAGKRLGTLIQSSTAESPLSALQRLLTSEVKELLRLFLEEEDACFRDLEYAELNSYFTLTRGTVAEEPVAKSERKSGRVLDLPVPSFVSIPAGTFHMGTSDEAIKTLLQSTDWAEQWKKEGWFEAEQPCHEVSVDAFKIGKYPVTNSEYEAFVRAEDGPKPPSHWSGGEVPDELAAHPVVNVSWQEAQAYCEWLTEKMRKSGMISASEVVRLPAEAEWERAARGDNECFWPWGSEWDAVKCNSSENGPGSTTPVGQYSPSGDSPFGLADMAGNVWEWCEDVFDAEAYQNRDDGWQARVWTDTDAVEAAIITGDALSRVVRGGSWGYPAEYCRSAGRDWLHPPIQYDYLGFRVVLTRSSVHERSAEREDG